MGSKGFFVASTGQNVGKTTTSLGLVAGLHKRKIQAGFMKPVGQEHVKLPSGEFVDKDVILFKEHFHLKDSYEHMSPVHQRLSRSKNPYSRPEKQDRRKLQKTLKKK